jgi:hypothetical protein
MLFNEWIYESENYRQKGIWINRDGNKILISKMSNLYIENIINALEKAITKLPPESYYVGNSDHAEDAVEAENRALELYREELDLWIYVFKEEQERRKSNE